MNTQKNTNENHKKTSLSLCVCVYLDAFLLAFHFSQ